MLLKYWLHDSALPHSSHRHAEAEGLAAFQLILRLDKEAVAAIPKAKIQLTVLHFDFPLLQPLAPAIGKLSGEPFFQLRKLRVGKRAMSLHLGYAPQLAVPFLNSRVNAVYLSAEIVIKVNGEATLALAGELFFLNEGKDFLLIF